MLAVAHEPQPEADEADGHLEQQPQTAEGHGKKFAKKEDKDPSKDSKHLDHSNDNLAAAEEGQTPQKPVIYEHEWQHAIYEGRKLPDDHRSAFCFKNLSPVSSFTSVHQA